MMIIGSDFIDNNASFNTVTKRNGAKLFVQAYATSGIVANTPMVVAFMGSGYNATVLAASLYGYVGVPEAAVASGCVGWVQIRGPVAGVQASAAESTGSVGHIIQWHAGTISASSSTYLGDPTLGEIGLLTTEADASTTLDIYLTGMWATPVAAG